MKPRIAKIAVVTFKLVFLILPFALVACGGGNDTSAAEPDNSGAVPTVSPTPTIDASPTPSVSPNPIAEPEGNFIVNSHSPAADAENQALTRTVSIYFNKSLVPASVSSLSIQLETDSGDVPHSLSYSEGETEIQLIPTQTLTPDTQYRVRLGNGLMSFDGDTLTDTSWVFTTAGNIGQTSQQTIDECMNDTDLAMLDAVNIARSNERSCGDDDYAAAAHLSWHCDLRNAAQRHSRDMATANFFDHTGSDGSSMRDRIDATGYSWSYIAENIAAGQSSVERVMEGWLNSPGHCRNIMNNALTEMGAALVDGASTSNYPTYWTQNFARPQN